MTSAAPVRVAAKAPVAALMFSRDTPTARMYLTSRPTSALAIETIAQLASVIIELKAGQREASKQYQLALGAMVAELMRAAAYDPPRACFRPLRTASFTGCDIGHQPFTRALADMSRNGFVALSKGVSAWRDREGMMTRIHLTPKLTDYLAVRGITVADRFKHFAYQLAKDDIPPVQLRATSAKKWPRVRGKRMTADYSHPAVARHASQIRRINAYLGQQTITGPDGEKMEIALRRIFNQGDQDGHDYQKGGRVYDDYQNIERERRPLMRINGHAVVEVDVSACFLTLVHHLLGQKFSHDDDPYGGTGLPRDIVKAWVNLTIGYSNYHTRWPSETIDKLADKGHLHVGRDFPIRMVREKVLAHKPIISAWVDSAHNWADLFFVESQIMIDAVEELAFTHNLPTLPLHDGLMVAAHHKAITRNVIIDSFHRNTGITPIVKL